MSNTPKLRFPEFKGEWEEKKLSDIASFSKGKGYTKNDLVKNGTPIVLYGRMYTKYETVISDIDTFVNLQVGSIISKGGEIIVPASGETAEEISRASVVKNKGIILGGDLNILSLQKDKYNPEFFALTISSGTSQKRLSKLAQGKSVVHLHNEDLSGLQIKVPSLAEQQKIADFLSNVDSIITAETKILNTLQKKKKALMQKLFTQQLRFKSDDGKDFPAWEEKKVIDFAKVDTGANNTQDKVEDGPYPFYVRSPIIYRSNKYIFDFPEAVLTVGDGVGTGKVFHYVQGKFDCHQRVYVIHDFENVLGKYFYFYFSEKFYARVKPMSAKNSVDSVRREMITDMKIPIPCKAEQQKIADCLSSLDLLIQTQQKVVTTWQQLKKALLQQMFI